MKLNPLPGREEKALASENDLLRGIILRQIKEQAQRDEAKKALEQEISTLQIKSDVINQQTGGSQRASASADSRRAFSLQGAGGLVERNRRQSDGSDDGCDQAQGGRDGLPGAERPIILTLCPKMCVSRFSMQKELFELKNFNDAEKIYQEIVEKVPENYFVLSNLGAVQIEGGKLSAAEVALKKAIQINGQESYPGPTSVSSTVGRASSTMPSEPCARPLR